MVLAFSTVMPPGVIVPEMVMLPLKEVLLTTIAVVVPEKVTGYGPV
jgi:hypothetical protein